MRAFRAALLAVAALLAGCGDTLVDHRNTEVLTDAAGCRDTEALCGGKCIPQGTQPDQVCGKGCSPCATAPQNATPVCLPTAPHDFTCEFECDPGLLRCAPAGVPGCCAPALVAAGGAFACASTSVADGGEVHCWGAGTEGQLGGGTAAARSTSARIAGLTGVAALAAGAAHACAISGSTTYCWGARAAFDGGTGFALVPEAVPALAGASRLSAGGAVTCAVVSGGVTCTGALASGGGSPGLSGALEVATGDAFSCALAGPAGGRSVWCWGDNGFGQLGTGDAAPPATMPFRVNVPTTTQLLAAGARHACAATDALTEALRCWGDNGSKQLGDFVETLLPPSVNLRVKKPIVAIAAGGLSSCAIELDPAETLTCWSSDAFAAGGVQLLGEPNHVAFGAPVGPVSVGGSHACFVETGVSPARLRCFGHDDRGQLGDGGSPVSNANPVLVIDR